MADPPTFTVQESQAVNDIGTYMASYRCMVTIDDDGPHFLGSAILVQIHDAVYVATAGHLFDNPRHPSVSFRWGSGNDKEAVRVRDVCRPSSAGIDVAAAKPACH